MAHNNKSAHKKDKHALIKEIAENKQSLRHGRDVIITLATFAYITDQFVTYTENPTMLEKISPAFGLFGIAATLIIVAKNLWDLDTAKANLKEITMPEADKASQKQKKAVQTTYGNRKQPSPIQRAIKVQ